ncbi:MAG: HPr(Ser) kinase/phosphatase [Deferribacteraceae bacterium]|jgi:HPr kinase/phosphorylase|nr:HPr(Ser) kinase/phosphatase [Deferribacteraceae bacterium]
MNKVSAATLIKNVSRLNLSIIYGHELLDGCAITSSRVQRPGLALAGYFDHIRPNRVQLFGETELFFLRTLPESKQEEVIDTLVKLSKSLLIVSKKLPVPELILKIAQNREAPVISSEQSTVQTNNEISYCLDYALAPETVMHGVFMDVCGLGAMIIGKSGIGKSECALELVKKGHRLVADDITHIKRRRHYVVGTSNDLLRSHIEVRGVGILNLSEIFGITAIRNRKKIDLVIEFINFNEWNKHTEANRSGLLDNTVSILDVNIPLILCPVYPGRNMSEIVELVAKNHILKLMKHDSSKMFSEKIQKQIELKRNG